MFLGGVVVEGRGVAEGFDAVAEQVAFGRMKITAGRVATQGPSSTFEFLPRRNAEGAFEERGEGSAGERMWSEFPEVEIAVRLGFVAFD